MDGIDSPVGLLGSRGEAGQQVLRLLVAGRKSCRPSPLLVGWHARAYVCTGLCLAVGKCAQSRGGQGSNRPIASWYDLTSCCLSKNQCDRARPGRIR